MAQKRTPQRMCTICRAQRPKRELIRLVKTSEGSVVLDKTGKQPGRGLYVCPEKSCLDQALKSGRLDKAVGAKVEEVVLNELRERANDDLKSKN